MSNISCLTSPVSLWAVDSAVFGVDAFVGDQVGGGYASDHQRHNDYNPDHVRIAVVMNVLKINVPNRAENYALFAEVPKAQGRLG